MADPVGAAILKPQFGKAEPQPLPGAGQGQGQGEHLAGGGVHILGQGERLLSLRPFKMDLALQAADPAPGQVEQPHVGPGLPPVVPCQLIAPGFHRAMQVDAQEYGLPMAIWAHYTTPGRRGQGGEGGPRTRREREESQREIKKYFG